MIVQSKILKNFLHSKKSIKTIIKPWQKMEILSNVLIGITLSWLLDQEIYKMLKSYLWIAILCYLDYYLNSKASNNIQKIGIILLSGKLY